jgi:hypothetical protein
MVRMFSVRGIGGLVVALLMVLSGCGFKGAHLERWHDHSAILHLRDVLVIALMEPDTQRRLWEASFAEELADRGVRAVPVHRLSGDPPTGEKLNGVIEQAGGAMVLLTFAAPAGGAEAEQPDTFSATSGRSRELWADYAAAPRPVPADPSAQPMTSVILESRLYRVDTGQLIWRACMGPIDPRRIKMSYGEEISRLIEDLHVSGAL